MELIILILLIYFAILIAKSSKKNKKTKATSSVELYTKRTNIKDISSFSEGLSFEQLNIKNMIYQALESFAILDTSPNLDTIQGRYEFIKDNILENLIRVYQSKVYITLVQIAMDDYRSTYYNTIIKQEWVDIILSPSLHKIEQFYAKCTIQTFGRFYQRQITELEKLKREEAKKRRKIKIEEARQTAIEMLNSISIDENEKLMLIESISKE